MPPLLVKRTNLTNSVIPAKAGIHFELKNIEQIKQSQNLMDPRFREDDGGGFIGVNLRLSAVK
jgi:hypothetical protein